LQTWLRLSEDGIFQTTENDGVSNASHDELNSQPRGQWKFFEGVLMLSAFSNVWTAPKHFAHLCLFCLNYQILGN